MTKIADLHIHSRYSMATSKDGNTETIAAWAEKKEFLLWEQGMLPTRDGVRN